MHRVCSLAFLQDRRGDAGRLICGYKPVGYYQQCFEEKSLVRQRKRG